MLPRLVQFASKPMASPSSAVDELRPGTAFGALRRFGSGVFRRRPLIGLPPALERFFIAFPVG